MYNKDKEEYKREYRRRFGEDIPDYVLNTLGSKGNKKVAKIKQKIKDYFKNKEGVTKKLLKNSDNSLGKDTMGYKKGGKVKRMSCPVDGMAKRGKTKVRRKGR